jgi:hypothetical protein
MFEIKLNFLDQCMTLVGLYSSRNIFWVIESRKMRWAGHEARTGVKRGVYKILVGKVHLEDPGEDVRIILKFAGSNPAEAVGFFRRKSPQHAFLRRGSEAVCPMSCFTAFKRTQK